MARQAMKLIYTEHALRRMAKRQLREDWIERAVENPSDAGSPDGSGSAATEVTEAAQIKHAMDAGDWLKLQGARNRRVAAQYLAPVLDAKRSEFWSHFAEHCRTQVLREAA